MKLDTVESNSFLTKNTKNMIQCSRDAVIYLNNFAQELNSTGESLFYSSEQLQIILDKTSNKSDCRSVEAQQEELLKSVVKR